MMGSACPWRNAVNTLALTMPAPAAGAQVFDMIETQMVRRGISNGFPMRILYRSIYVIVVAFVGVRQPRLPQLYVHACTLALLLSPTCW